MSKADALIAVSVVIGPLLILWRSKRKFSRLNQLGIEQFTSFSHKVRAMALDVILLGTGFGLLGAAVTLYMVEYAQPFVAAIFLVLIIWVFQSERPRSGK